MTLLFINESFDLYVGSDDADNAKKNKITNLSIPELEEMTSNFHAGGSKFEIEIGGLGFKALSAKFHVVGWDPQVMNQIGINNRAQYPFIIKSLVRDKLSGRGLGVKIVLWGRLTKLSPSEMKRGDLYGHDHEIKEVMHYELYLDQQEKYYWDYASDTFRVNGVIQNQDELNFL